MDLIKNIKKAITRKRKPEFLNIKGKIVYPYTLMDGVLDEDDTTLKDKMGDLIKQFKDVKNSVENGALAGPKGDKGENGSNIELKEEEGFIKWKLDNEDEWKILFKISDFIKSEGTTIEVVDNLVTKDKTKALSANQGYLLQESMTHIVDFVKENIKLEDTNINERLAANTLSPGYIDDDGDVIVEPDEWTMNYYEQVDPDSIYTLYFPTELELLRLYFYGINSDGKMILKNSDSFFNVTEMDIDIPDDIYYIKLGFNTKNPLNMIINYKLEKLG